MLETVFNTIKNILIEIFFFKKKSIVKFIKSEVNGSVFIAVSTLAATARGQKNGLRYLPDVPI